LAEGLRERGHRVVLMSSCPVLLDSFKEAGFDTYEVWGGKMVVTKMELLKFPFLAPFIFSNLGKHLLEIKRKHQIDTLYCLSLNEKVLLTPLASLLKIKIFWVEHQQLRDWIRKSPLRFPYRRWSQKVKIVPVSQWNKKRLKEIKVNDENVVEVLNGVDLEELRRIKSVQIQTEEKEKTPKVGVVARLIKKKGVEYLVKAAALFKEWGVEADFVVIGDGEERGELDALIEKFNLKRRFQFLSRLEREEYLKTLSSFDVLVLPSLDDSETFGLVIAEAMAVEVPVVVTEVCGIARYLKNEENALIVPPADEEALAKAIKKVLKVKSLREKLIENAGELVEKKFSLEQMVENFEQLFRE